MATNYPGSIDSLPRPTSTTAMDAAGYEGDVVIDNISDAVEAIETELGTDPAGAQSTVAARLDYNQIFNSSTGIYWPSGGWSCNAVNTGNASSLTVLGNKLVVAPLLCPTSVTLDRMAVRVVTAQTSATARLGLYTSNSDGGPDTRVADFGEVDCSSTGAKELTISQAVTGGVLYYLALLNSTNSVAYQSYVNAGRPLRLENTSDVTPQGIFRYDATYGSGLPSTLSGTGDSGPGSGALMFQFRRT